MYALLKHSQEEIDAVILNTAAKKGVGAAIVEKDLWVSLTLDYLFHHCRWKDRIAFKGGTCLSKVYGLIERFSEDIDLILDWRVLGYGINEPWKERSNTKQEAFILDSRERLFAFLRNEFLPEFRKGMGELLGKEINAYIEDDDLGTVHFAYPSSFTDSAIVKTIRLEIGVLGSWLPLQKGVIKPFVAEEYPNLLSYSEVELLATTPERTFWEKATILHQEAFRPEGSKVPDRYSRHYYDLYMMGISTVKDSALSKPGLLEEVAHFKMKFYPRKWARYDLAKFGTIKLTPAKHSLPQLIRDYERMASMIYGPRPSFEEILKLIAALEDEINSLS